MRPGTLRVRSPILGDFLLVPHGAEEDAGSHVIGYVTLADDPSRLLRAIRLNGGGWSDAGNKPFPRPVAAWYSMEKPDGSPLF